MTDSLPRSLDQLAVATGQEECRRSDCNCPSLSRRRFIELTGAAAVSLSTGSRRLSAIAGPFSPSETSDHFVPADKKLTPRWKDALFAKGESTVYSGADLQTIGMPIGGVCAGQLYLTGDGRLAHWDIFNQHIFTGYGRDNYELGRHPDFPLAQGFALRTEVNGKTIEKSLSIDDFPQVTFCGEYPIGTVDYSDADTPVAVKLEAFSPFIPLNATDSGLPATLLEFTLKNVSQSKVSATLAGWLQNGVCLVSGEYADGNRMNQVVRSNHMTLVLGSAVKSDTAKSDKTPIILADFEGADYGDWRVEGEAFGKKPAAGTLKGQQKVSGFKGKGLVNTFIDGDRPVGKLTSPPFKIDRAFINYLVGGGGHGGKTCLNLIVDGTPVRTAAGKNNERLEWKHWNVREFAGKEGTIEIIDQASDAWGHINVDQIELADQPKAAFTGPLSEQPDYGTMGLALLDSTDVVHATSVPDVSVKRVFAALSQSSPSESRVPLSKKQVGCLGKKINLAPGEEATVRFAVVWHFPNRTERNQPVGNYYATRFSNAADVAKYVAENYERLAGDTRRWHATWYDSTLPHWLLDRLFLTASTLATSTCQRWANGRFWAWEGVGCCHGTCTHVWNYEHSLARLFPEMERSTREMQDYNPEAGFVEATGMIRFRGEDWNKWAGDGQAGTVLKAYREHQMTTDDAFLKRNWPRIRKSLEFLIKEDGNGDGLLEGSQHNTYDINFYGPNTMVGSLYLAALHAGEAMAKRMGDTTFAEQCRALYESGSRLTVDRLFNGEYFIQDVDLTKHPQFQYANGCLSDQLFGQGWADQVGLGYIYPPETVRSTLQSIWKYNWAPDVDAQNEAHKPERWFARPGEAGLFTCTWPKGPYLAAGVRYKNEVWTGIEYQVAGHMAWEGMVTEALAICRAIHERYHPSKHNPWNEIECGDHYARCMASHGVFLGLCGFECDGPAAHFGFAPRFNPAQFQAAYTSAASWGTISQNRKGQKQTNEITVAWGELRLKSLALELPDAAALKSSTVRIGEKSVHSEFQQTGNRVTFQFSESITVGENETLQVELLMS